MNFAGSESDVYIGVCARAAAGHVWLLLRRLWLLPAPVADAEPNVQGAAGKEPVAGGLGSADAATGQVSPCLR